MVDVQVEATQTATNHDMTTHEEGPVAKAIEQRTAKLPSDLFLWGAFAAIGASAALQLAGRQKLSNFVGQWAPTILIMGVYNKIVKVLGSDGEGVAGRDVEPTLH